MYVGCYLHRALLICTSSRASPSNASIEPKSDPQNWPRCIYILSSYILLTILDDAISILLVPTFWYGVGLIGRGERCSWPPAAVTDEGPGNPRPARQHHNRPNRHNLVIAKPIIQKAISLFNINIKNYLIYQRKERYEYTRNFTTYTIVGTTLHPHSLRTSTASSLNTTHTPSISLLV